MKKLQIAAIFVSLLVIMLPVYSANVFAVSMDVKVYGDAGLDGYIKRYDATIVNALIDVPNVAESQVTFEGQSFDECTNNGSNSDCYLYFPRGTVAGGKYPYSVRYSIQSVQGDVIVDEEKPDVKDVIMQQIGTGNVSIDY